MTGDGDFAFDDSAPVSVGYLPNEFGLVFPSSSGFTIRSQTGGVCCHQLEFSGAFLPLGRPKLNRGFPEWMPETDGGISKGERHPVTTVDLETIPERDYESLPEWVKERGHFYNWDEFSYWIDEHAWWYLWTDLVKELRDWNYDADGSMPNSRDLTRVWDSYDEIWAAIDDTLNFIYKEYDYLAAKRAAIEAGESFDSPFPDEYPAPCEGIRWITITGSKTDSDGNPLAPWADDLAGTHALLSYPNSD